MPHLESLTGLWSTYLTMHLPLLFSQLFQEQQSSGFSLSAVHNRFDS